MKTIRNIFAGNSVAESPLLFVIDLVQLLMFFLAVYLYKIEIDSGLIQIAPFVLGAFVLASVVNKKHMEWVFILLAITIIFYAFSWFSGFIFFIFFAFIFCVFSVKLNIYLKILIFLLALTAFAILRTGYLYAPRMYLVIPFISAIFMFRGISFLYYHKNHKIKGTLRQRLAYFLMFPNLVFLLFPIVDFKEFVTSHLVKPISDTRQKALRYLLRAITHLLLYRLLYISFFIGQEQVQDLPTLLQYLMSSYLLILRLSGILHMSMAFLCLFGYDLSPVFNYFFLGKSFADLWRRINTYWRNFMQKVFFYPAYFKIRKPFGIYALPMATALMFVCTWFFHNYQMFWLRGVFNVSTPDILFWLILGTSITLNVTYLDYKARHKIKKTRSANAQHWLNACFIILCFMYMCLLWSLWSSSDLTQWTNVLSKFGIATTGQILLVVGIFISMFFFLYLGGKLVSQSKIKDFLARDYGTTRFITIPSFVLLIAFPYILKYADVKNKAYAEFVDFSAAKRDKLKNEKGYYKQLIDGNNQSSGAWEVSLLKPLPPGDIDMAIELTSDIYLRKIKPSVEIVWNDKLFKTNSHGMRDKQYTLKRPVGCMRMAILGGSYEMGSGVANDAVFEGLVEKELNEKNTNDKTKSFEILNFGCGGYHVIQQYKILNEEVLKFKPQVVLLFAHSRDQERLAGFVGDLIRSGINLEYDFLNSIKQKTGVRQNMSEKEIKEKLRPFALDIIKWAYKGIYQNCAKNNIIPVLVYLPATNDIGFEKERDLQMNFAGKLGYQLIDLSNVYTSAGYTQANMKEITVEDTDPHPNAIGHKIIANKLYEQLLENSTIFIPQK